jgi:hypothetical protein
MIRLVRRIPDSEQWKWRRKAKPVPVPPVDYRLVYETRRKLLACDLDDSEGAHFCAYDFAVGACRAHRNCDLETAKAKVPAALNRARLESHRRLARPFVPLEQLLAAGCAHCRGSFGRLTQHSAGERRPVTITAPRRCARRASAGSLRSLRWQSKTLAMIAQANER